MKIQRHIYQIFHAEPNRLTEKPVPKCSAFSAASLQVNHWYYPNISVKKQETLFALCETCLNLSPLSQSNTPVFLMTYQKYTNRSVKTLRRKHAFN